MKGFLGTGDILLAETAGTTIWQVGRLPFSSSSYTDTLLPPYAPRADPLELWYTGMDPSTISVEAVVVYGTRDLDPQYARKPPVDYPDFMDDYIDNVQLATNDMILDECSNPVDLTAIQNGEEVKSGAAAPDLYIRFHRARVNPGCCFTTVKHLKNPRWKWVEEVVDVYKPVHTLTYEREPAQAQQDDVADVNANQCCALA